jgi:predicted homoserine dehydrogenase-like protein
MRSDVLVETTCGKSQLVPSGRGGEAILVLRPMHLLGVEAAASILSAAILGVPTGAREYRPTFDRVIRARRALKAGERLGGDHSPDLAGEIAPAVGFAPNDPIPAHLAEGNLLAVDVPAGERIQRRHVRRPPDSALWALRERQDALFAPGANR